jgi:hypothetical protein
LRASAFRKLTRLGLIVALPLLQSFAQAADPVADATAKFLAGLPVQGTPLEGKAADPAWTQHVKEFEHEWAQFDENQHQKIQEWREQALPQYLADQEPLFYLFSGPDFLYASAFFPNAPTYILCGMEPIGSIPDINTLSSAELNVALTNLRKTVESSLDWSFFITKKMKTDLAGSRLTGTLPILFVFLARTNCTIESIIPVQIDANGNLTEETKKTIPGIRIVFSSEGAATQTLYYFTTDLSDWSVKANPGFLKFCEQQGRGTSLLKAASYLMHRGTFTTVRDFLLRNSDLIVEDDSGIPFRFFSDDHWMLQLYGRYAGPIPLFKEFPQPDLTKAFTQTNPPMLGFSFGYQWHPSRSSLIVATAKQSPDHLLETPGTGTGDD